MTPASGDPTADAIDRRTEPAIDEKSAEDRSPSAEAAPSTEPGFFETLVGFLKPRAPQSLRDELVESLATAEGDDDGFAPSERALLTRILALTTVRVEDVMVARAEIEAIGIDATLGELMERFEESGHSRMPVYGDGLDDPRGMVHIRDVVGHITRAALAFRDVSRPNGTAVESGLELSQVDLSQSIEGLDLLRKVLFVPPSMPATELMTRMQAARIQMALVIDEYGGTDGLVSLEDLLEMVVGDIEDEHDDDESLVTAAGDGVFYADARAELEEVREVVGDDFDIAPFEEDADTIGGLLVTVLGRVPEEGEVVEAVTGFHLQVIEAEPRRVKRVRIVRFHAGEVHRPAVGQIIPATGPVRATREG